MSFLKEKGQGLVEYALILVLVAVVVIAALSLLGPQINSAYARVISALGGTVPYTYTITGGPTINSSFSAGLCTYHLSMSVKVEDSGVAVDGESISASVSGGPASGSPPAKTTNSSGVATWANATIKTVGGACQSGSSTVTAGSASGSASY